MNSSKTNQNKTKLITASFQVSLNHLDFNLDFYILFNSLEKRTLVQWMVQMQLKNIEIGFLMNYLRTLARLKLNKQKLVKIARPDKSSL